MRIIVGMFGGLVIGALIQSFLYELGLVDADALAYVFFGVWGGCAVAGSFFWYRNYAGADSAADIDDISVLPDCDEEMLKHSLKADGEWVARQVLLVLGSGRFVEADGVQLRAVRDVTQASASEADPFAMNPADAKDRAPVRATSVTAAGRLVFSARTGSNGKPVVRSYVPGEWEAVVAGLAGHRHHRIARLEAARAKASGSDMNTHD